MQKRAKMQQEETVEESIVLALFDLSNHLMKKGEELASAAGITTQQWILLLQIVGDPNFFLGTEVNGKGLLPSEIARSRGVSRANVSALISGLMQRGLVRQVKDKSDGRCKRLVATAAGKRALASIEPSRRAANQNLLAGLTDRQREKFLTSLTRCLEVVRRPDDEE